MRFVAVIMLRDILVARVSVDPLENEAIQQTAYRGRERLLRDANRTRPASLSDTILNGFGDAFRDVIAAQLLTGESRDVTCVSRNGNVVSGGSAIVIQADGAQVYRIEGQVALLTKPEDFICLITAHDDAWIAEREAFTDQIFQSA